MSDDLANKAASAASAVDHAVEQAVGRATRTRTGASLGMVLIGVIATGILAGKKRKGQGRAA